MRKSNKIIISIIGLIFMVVAMWAASFYWSNLRGIGPAIKKPVGDIKQQLDKNLIPAENKTDFPLKLSDGFKISVFADDLPGARVIEFDFMGNAWISQTSMGIISMLEIKGQSVIRKSQPFRNLNKPHGLAFDNEQKTLLYIAEEDKISKVLIYTESGPDKISELPSGDGHYTRSLGLGPDNQLYLSIGSSCNICNEKDERRAKILLVDKDTGSLREYARGLRNSVFFTWNPKDKKLWATDNGRDLLGDDLPPDEINIIEEGKNYGWPTCYGRNIHDTSFDKNIYIRNPCLEPFETESYIDIQAHSAPLGLAFIPQNSGWPKEYEGDLVVALHGSWNRSIPTGYKLIRIDLDEYGEYKKTEDFITGWLTKDGAMGRPVDVKFFEGSLYVTDDKAGLIYRIEYNN